MPGRDRLRPTPRPGCVTPAAGRNRRLHLCPQPKAPREDDYDKCAAPSNAPGRRPGSNRIHHAVSSPFSDPRSSPAGTSTPSPLPSWRCALCGSSAILRRERAGSGVPIDGLVFTRISEELRRSLKNARVQGVFQPSSTELLLHLRQPGRTHRLLISIDPDLARLHLTNEEPENPLSPPPFCLLLRKHLVPGRIVDVWHPPFERSSNSWSRSGTKRETERSGTFTSRSWADTATSS